MAEERRRWQFARRVVPAHGPGEDCAEIIETRQGALIVVADGAGHTVDAREAARAVVDRMRATVSERAVTTGADLVRVLRARDQESPGPGQTTAVGVLITEKHLHGASAGDSVAWFVQPLGMVDLTAGQHPLRIGSGNADPTPFTARIFPGTLMVATDGLWKYAPAEKLCAIARDSDLERAADALVDAVRLRSGALQDDVGFVLARQVNATSDTE